MRKHIPAILALSLFATLACAGAIKSWSSSETLRSADLNSNFSHIHNNMVGGHGARLVNADVSASAAISLSKINVTAIAYPKAWAQVPLVNLCNTGSYPAACTPLRGTGVTSISNTALGRYQVTLSYTPTDLDFAVMVTPIEAASPGGRACSVLSLATTAPQFSIQCFDLATPTATGVGFSFIIMDDN